MFTGIIQKVRKVTDSKLENEITTLTIEKPEDWELTLGQSIATNGVCVTVTKINDTTYETELMPETLKRTTFGEGAPELVNLEHAMAANGLLEGHIVQGHVDAVGQIVDIEQSEKWRTLKISYPKDKSNLLVEKGSVTLDGISLTLVDVTDDWFSVSLIPHTLENTTIGKLKKGDFLNIEFDIIAKFIAKKIEK